MRTLVTPEEMQRADQRAVDEGTPVEVLMDRAGHAVARSAIRMLGGRYGKKVVVVCGKGNNGGDGYAAARILKREGVRVTCFWTADTQTLKGAALHHYDLARRAGVRISEFDAGDLDADLIVDAIYGTGLEPRSEGLPEPEWRAISAISPFPDSGPAPVLAVDIPSGLSGLHGVIGGSHIVAERTVTFAAEKVGTFLSPPEHVGQVEIADIGIVPHGDIQVMDPPDVALMLPRRKVDSHKRSAGNMLVLAGSDAMTGAPALVVRGAFRAGCGYVTVATTERSADVVRQMCPEALVRVVTDQDHLGPACLDEVEDLLDRATVIAAGPGLGTGDDQFRLVDRLVREVECALVLDADALNVLNGRLEDLKMSKARIAITPHSAELARLLGASVDEVDHARLSSARRATAIAGCDVLLKGYRTVISGPMSAAVGWRSGPDLVSEDRLDAAEWPMSDVYLNPTGSRSLATAGTGDVLTGVVAAILGASETTKSTRAVAAAAYVHGLAGEIAAREKSESGVVAWDVAEAIPSAIQAVLSGAGVSR